MEVTNGQRHDRIAVEMEHKVPIEVHDSERMGQDFEVSITQKMLSAVTGSVLTSLLVTPLDVVRVRLQSQQPPMSRFRSIGGLPNPAFSNLPSNLGVTACCREVFWVNNNAQFCVVDSSGGFAVGESAGVSAECAAEELQRKTYTSTFDGLRKIARNEGLTTLWRGLSPTLLMAVPANVIYFSGYDWLRSSQRSPMFGRVSDIYAPLVAGSTARILAALAVGPIELLRTRMQAARGKGTGSILKQTLGDVTEMVQSQGYRSLWRGLTLTLWRDVPFSAFYWWGYEATRNTITNARDRSSGLPTDDTSSITRSRSLSRGKQDSLGTLMDSFAAGAFSGAIASVITTPFDVGKTRQQVFQPSVEAKLDPLSQVTRELLPEERSMPRLLWHIFREEGVAGLFRGWAARTLKVAPACAIMISTYELGKKMAYDMKKAKLEE